MTAERPAWLPLPGAPCDLATAAAILNHYLAEMRAELRRAEREIRARYLRGRQAVMVRQWTPQMIVDHWGAEIPAILVGFVSLDDIGHRARFRDVRIVIDKETGALRVEDDSGLLGSASADRHGIDSCTRR